MRFRLTSGGLDLATGALILGGAVLIAASLVAAISLVAPAPATTVVEPAAADPTPMAPATAAPGSSRPSVALSADQVATVLLVDAATGAGSVTRPGDRVDVLGYFSRQVIGPEGLTRMLLQDVAVLTVEHAGPSVALTLAVPHDGALLLQEAQAIGARPFVTLRSFQVSPDAPGVPTSFSDTDLAGRLAGLR